VLRGEKAIGLELGIIGVVGIGVEGRGVGRGGGGAGGGGRVGGIEASKAAMVIGRCAFRTPRVVFVLGLVSLINSLTSGKNQ